MMLLDGKILKGDHSFKIIKHMASIEGTSMFTALYTVCNESEEIRLMLLVPTKSLDHLRWSFEKLVQAYKEYGHEQPTVFFTDNVRSNNFDNDNVLKLPVNISVLYLREFYEINDALKTVVEK